MDSAGIECKIIDVAIPIDECEWYNIHKSYIPGYTETNDLKNPPCCDINLQTISNYVDMDILCDDMKDVDLDTITTISKPNITRMLPVAVAESITAGALSNTLCSEPGSSKFFLGGVIAYNMMTQKTMLNIDDVYAEKHNFANPFTTFDMAKNVSKLFNARIGISTTGFSLPTYRDEDLTKGKCKIDVKIPYAYICLYDALTDTNIIHKITNTNYSEQSDKKIQRAQMQAKVALYCKKIFEKYCLDQAK